MTISADALFEALAHGDADHKAWLKEAINAHLAGEPVPAPRGKGNKEARIAALEAALDAIMVEYRRFGAIGVDVMFDIAKEARGGEPASA